MSALPQAPERLDDALALGCLLAGTVAHPKLYPAGHPARAIALAELAKLLLVPAPPAPPPPPGAPDHRPASLLPETLFRPTTTLRHRPVFPSSPLGRLTTAREALVVALAELRIGFGAPEGGRVGREVAGLIEGVERELQGLLASR